MGQMLQAALGQGTGDQFAGADGLPIHAGGNPGLLGGADVASPQEIAFQQGNQIANEAQNPSDVLRDFTDLFGGASRGLSALNAFDALNVPQSQAIPGNSGVPGFNGQFFIPGEQQVLNMLLGLGAISGNPPRFR